MRLTREDILHLADLARLDLSEEEVQSAGEDLGKVLGYIDRLAVVPTEGVEPYASPRRADWRQDAAMPCDDIVRDAVIKNFPDSRGALLKTPGVFAHPKS